MRGEGIPLAHYVDRNIVADVLGGGLGGDELSGHFQNDGEVDDDIEEDFVEEMIDDDEVEEDLP